MKKFIRMYCKTVNKTFTLFDVQLHNISYHEILNSIKKTFHNQKKLSICYVNVNSLNLSYKNQKIKNLFSEFDIVHPDGFGVFLGSKILLGKLGQSSRINGSDLYEHLINYGIEHKCRFFFFGDEEITLSKININYPQLKVAGTQNGYDFENTSLISKINQNNTDILVVGLGTTKQEEWIVRNKRCLDVKVIIAVGDGIKVFSGTKKRGPKIIQIFGLEWFVRLFFNPVLLWKRYIIGIPLFIYRIMKLKFSISIR